MLCFQQMMPSNPSLLLGPNNLSGSHPCGPWEGSHVLGKSTVDMGSHAAWCQTLVCRGHAE